MGNIKLWPWKTVGNSCGQYGCPISNSASALSSTKQYHDHANSRYVSITNITDLYVFYIYTIIIMLLNVVVCTICLQQRVLLLAKHGVHFCWNMLKKFSSKLFVGGQSKTSVKQSFDQQTFLNNWHCIKYARKRVFSDPYVPDRYRIEDPVFVRDYTGQKKPAFWYILYSVVWNFQSLWKPH